MMFLLKIVAWIQHHHQRFFVKGVILLCIAKFFIKSLGGSSVAADENDWSWEDNLYIKEQSERWSGLYEAHVHFQIPFPDKELKDSTVEELAANYEAIFAPINRYGPELKIRIQRAGNKNSKNVNADPLVLPIEWESPLLNMSANNQASYKMPDNVQKLHESNQKRLKQLEKLLLSPGSLGQENGETLLCKGPFPPHPAAFKKAQQEQEKSASHRENVPPEESVSYKKNVDLVLKEGLRWLHIPKCGTTFANTFLPWVAEGCATTSSRNHHHYWRKDQNHKKKEEHSLQLHQGDTLLSDTSSSSSSSPTWPSGVYLGMPVVNLTSPGVMKSSRKERYQKLKKWNAQAMGAVLEYLCDGDGTSDHNTGGSSNSNSVGGNSNRRVDNDSNNRGNENHLLRTPSRIRRNHPDLTRKRTQIQYSMTSTIHSTGDIYNYTSSSPSSESIFHIKIKDKPANMYTSTTNSGYSTISNNNNNNNHNNNHNNHNSNNNNNHNSNNNVINDNNDNNNHAFSFTHGDLGIERIFREWTEHAPLRSSPVGTVALFRSPAQRVLSAYYYGRQIWNDGLPKGVDKYTSKQWSQKVLNDIERVLSYGNEKELSNNGDERVLSYGAAVYASTPGISGAMTRLVAGCAASAQPVATQLPTAAITISSGDHTTNPTIISAAANPTTNPPTTTIHYNWTQFLVGSGPGQLLHRSSYTSEELHQGFMQGCGGYEVRPVDRHMAEYAAKKVRDMAFVGVQEFFKSSVCLFHRKFGGVPNDMAFARFNVNLDARSKRKGRKQRKRDPLPVLLSPSSSINSSKKKHDENLLRGWIDELDEIVFAAVLDRFENDLAEFLTLPQE